MIAKCSLLPPSPMSENDLRYTVFVGGSEVTDWLVTLKTARVVSRFYEEQGYDDVVIVDTKSDLPVTTKQGEIQ
jgi:hypothetical protein